MRFLLGPLCLLGSLALTGACGDNAADPDPDSGTPGGALTAEIVSPVAGALIAASPATVRVRATAERGLARARIEAGGRSVAIAPGQFDANGEADVRVPLVDAASELRLVVEDTIGQTADARASLVVDLEGPAIAVGAPLAGTAETRRLLFAELTDETGIAAVSYAVNDGAPHAVAVADAPSRLVLREALALAAGANRVAITMTDRAGHTRTETIAFRYGLVTSAGGAHSGAIEAGELQTWGRYNVGQLGLGGAIGDSESRLAPERVPTFGAAATEVAAIAFNQNTSLALRSDGTVWTWGANGDGQLGHGDTVQRTVPAQVAGASNIVYATLGFSNALALRADGAVLAWGNNAVGQAGVEGDGTVNDDQLAPVEVAGIPAPVVKVAAGSDHSLALTVDGRVFVWGSNQFGKLGNGTVDRARHAAPAAVPGLTGAIDIATGKDHLLAVRADGSVVAWGLGETGQLGDGADTGEDRAVPIVVVDAAGAPLGGARAVFANGNTSSAIVAAGERLQYWGWGQNFNGQLAIGATSRAERSARRATMFTPGAAPVFLDERVELASIGVGATHTIARTATGALWAWGWSFRGSLGVPTLLNAWAQTVAVEVVLAE